MTQEQIDELLANADPYRVLVAAMFAQARCDTRSQNRAVAEEAKTFLASDDALCWVGLAEIDLDPAALAM